MTPWQAADVYFEHKTSLGLPCCIKTFAMEQGYTFQYVYDQQAKVCSVNTNKIPSHAHAHDRTNVGSLILSPSECFNVMYQHTLRGCSKMWSQSSSGHVACRAVCRAACRAVPRPVPRPVP